MASVREEYSEYSFRPLYNNTQYFRGKPILLMKWPDTKLLELPKRIERSISEHPLAGINAGLYQEWKAAGLYHRGNP